MVTAARQGASHALSSLRAAQGAALSARAQHRVGLGRTILEASSAPRRSGASLLASRTSGQRSFAPLAASHGSLLHAFARSSSSTRAFSLTAWGRSLRLNALRRKADETPGDLGAESALLAELAELGQHKELVERWESKAGLFDEAVDRANPYLRDDEGFRLYLRSLASLASSSSNAAPLFSKLAAAPTQRAAALEGTPVASAPVSEAASVPPAADQVPEPQPARPQLSTSALVSALFSGPGSRGKGGDVKFVGGASGAAAGAQEPIRIIVEEAKAPLWKTLIRTILVIGFYSFLVLSFLSLLLDQTGILRATTAQSSFSPIPPPDPEDPQGRGVSFKDVHGCDEAKEELVEVVEFLKDPKKFQRLGGRLPRGILLTGPPGTGKTLLARAVAGEAGVSVFTASGSEFDEMYVGVGARRMRELFAAARKAAPAVVFIDELDAVGGKRSPRDMTYSKQTLNQLLVELDGFNPAGEGIILIGATNFPEALDKALIRPGRFDRHIAVPLPDVRGRMQILTHHLRDIAYDKSALDLSIIARGTIGFSGAELQALVNQAAVRASVENAQHVGLKHLAWARERIMMGAERKSAVITEKDKLMTAYHEGGHTLVALYTPFATPLESVTVVPRGNALGITLMLPEMDKHSHTLSEYKARIDVAMGGRVAEELIYGRDNITDGASSDISNATSVASAMVRRFGFSDLVGPVAHAGDSDDPVSPQTAANIDSEIRGLIEGAQARAQALLTSKRDELERLAQALVKYETLTHEEVRKVVAGEPIERPV